METAACESSHAYERDPEQDDAGYLERAHKLRESLGSIPGSSAQVEPCPYCSQGSRMSRVASLLGFKPQPRAGCSTCWFSGYYSQ